MNLLSRRITSVACLLLLTGLVGAQPVASGPTGSVIAKFNADQPAQDTDGELKNKEPVSFGFPRSNKQAYFSFSFRVPQGTKSVLLRVSGATADVDLFVSFNKPVEDWNENAVDYLADTGKMNEVLWFDGTSKPALRPGLYYVDVRAVDPNATTNGRLTLVLDAERPANFKARERIQVVALQNNVAQHVTFNREVHKHQTFTIDVPATAKVLRIELFNASSDLDLYVKLGEPVADWNDPDKFDHSAVTPRVDEVLEINKQSVPPLKAGKYHIDVVCFPDDLEVKFSIVASLDGKATVPALRLPPFRDAAGLGALQRAVDACVSVEADEGSGSGTVVTPNGYVLTNFHVIGDDETGEYQRDNIFISFTEDVKKAPRQCFIAKVVFADVELDLALLKIHQTVRGEAVEDKTMKLTWLPLGDSQKLDLGDTLRVLGFPAVGSERARSTLTLTKGIVSGFDTKGNQPVWIKTDAAVGSGNSGGTTINDAGELVAVPTMVISQDSDKLSYLRPVAAIPSEWVKRIRENLPK